MKKAICKSALAVLVGVCCMSAQAQQKTEITFQRCVGACDADYGKVVDVTKARGECGIITALTNQFNATNKQGIVVKTQIAEWGPYYDQLTARIVAKDVPTIAVMHESVLGDFVSRKLVEPLDEGFKSVGIDTRTSPIRRPRVRASTAQPTRCHRIRGRGYGTSTSTSSRKPA